MQLMIIGLQYDSGMNFHSLIVKGFQASEKERDMLAKELRRRYRQLVADAEKGKSIKLESEVRSVGMDAQFAPIVLPSGNDRFRHVFLISLIGSHWVRNPASNTLTQSNSTRTNELIRRFFFGDKSVRVLANRMLARLVLRGPELLTEAMLLGSLVLSDKDLDRNEPDSNNVVCNESEEIQRKAASFRPLGWLCQLGGWN